MKGGANVSANVLFVCVCVMCKCVYNYIDGVLLVRVWYSLGSHLLSCSSMLEIMGFDVSGT